MVKSSPCNFYFHLEGGPHNAQVIYSKCRVMELTSFLSDLLVVSQNVRNGLELRHMKFEDHMRRHMQLWDKSTWSILDL